MKVKIVFVPHGAKLTDIGYYPPAIASDPPMTMEGKINMLKLVWALTALGPYDGVYCSLMDRALGSMSTVVKAMSIKRVVCIDELGQMGNLDADGKVISYPGHENDNVVTWQIQGVDAVLKIWNEITPNMITGDPLSSFGDKPSRTVLVFSHRPILAGLVAKSRGITDAPGIQAILDDKALVKNGFTVFGFDGYNLTLAE